LRKLRSKRSKPLAFQDKKMRHLFSATLLLTLATVIFFSCKKYKDPAPTTDPRLTNPYCNDPEAVNYNWGFPGKPDNSICFYPSDLFAGNYYCHDTVYVTSSGLLISTDSFYINISRLSATNHSKIGLKGFPCDPNMTLMLTAGYTYDAVTDTLIGDSTTLHRGQQFCSPHDTITGTITRDRVSDTVLHLSFQVFGSDTSQYTHTGTAKKL
jgi:hypothetical protein